MKILIAGVPEHTVNYARALTFCGASFDIGLCPHDLSSYDKLLIPGGGDIHPSWFGQEDQGSLSVDRELDRAQLGLLHAFILAGKPVLGICRGIQLINVCLGGDLIQHLPTADTHRYKEQDQIHSSDCLSGSLLFQLYGSSPLINSAHHQGLGRIATGFAVTQKAPDGVVEGIEHKTRPILGVQWHPERTGLSSHQTHLADGSKLIHYFSKQM